MRLATAEQSVDEYLHYHMGYSLSELLAPIGENEVGESVRHNGVYFNIKAARESDDPSLPMGEWAHELKTADWPLVKKLTLDALAEKSKDLQLGVWLLEANIHLKGFAGVAPATLFIQQLCENYWPNMHPQMVDGDVEYRTNPISWINDKLTPVIRLIPFTHANLDGNDYCWNDWDSAQYFEKLKNQNQLNGQYDGPSPQDIKQRLAASDMEFLQTQLDHIEDGIQAIGILQHWLDECCGNESPNLSDISGILKQIDEMLVTELERRGVRFISGDEADTEDGEYVDDDYQQAQGSGGGSGGNGNGPLKSRQDAFIQLRKAAEFLMNDDPHSPVPYLVYTACDWGEKTAPDLYQELFLAKGGQLNIFEMMGLSAEGQ